MNSRAHGKTRESGKASTMQPRKELEKMPEVTRPRYEPKPKEDLTLTERKLIAQKTKFADSSFPMDWVTESLSRSTFMNVRGWKVQTPTSFVVYRSRFINDLEDNQAKLQKYMEEPLCPPKEPGLPMQSRYKAKNDQRLRLNLEDDNTGLFVSVFYRDEWHRAVIVNCFFKKYEEKQLCTVYTLDFGEHVELAVKSLRRIPEMYLKLPAQAIQCSLNFKGKAQHLNQLDRIWYDGESSIFKKIMQDARFAMKIEESVKPPSGFPNPVVWRVRIFIRTQVNNVWIRDEETVADKFLKEIERAYSKQKVTRNVATIEPHFWQETQQVGSIARLTDDHPGCNENLNQLRTLIIRREKKTP